MCLRSLPAIKEEDPRRKLPWLRYVALCSPAIGDELREIQSTARRFELVDLSQNAFADVSDFVKTLAEEGRLSAIYPVGIVEAAYAMSGGNFGWFNVIMANVDGRLRLRQTEKAKQSHQETLTIGSLFDELAKTSSRIRDYILDHSAINELQIDRAYLPSATELLYGQLPVPLSQWQPEELQALLTAQNEYDEPLALRYRQVEWDELDCSKALRSAKFTRDRDLWRLQSVSQPLDLRQLLDNLSTYAIYARRTGDTAGQFNRTPDGKRILLVPLTQYGFIELVTFLYPHPAADDAARALWQSLIGDAELPNEDATHVGPSIAMLERLDLRYRKRSQTSLIFRDPDQSSAHEQAMVARKQQRLPDRAREILTGIMRVLDRNWTYDKVSVGIPADAIAITTPLASRGREQGGLVTCHALKLHPQGRAILAWVQNEPELEALCEVVNSQFGDKGKTPTIAFTSSRALVDRLKHPASDRLKNARNYLLLYQLSTNEEYVLHRVGLSLQDRQGFKIEISNFNTAFTQRINAFQRSLLEEIQRWRQDLDRAGQIAWPLRPSGSLKPDEKELLIRTWKYLLFETADRTLHEVTENSGLNIEAFTAILAKLNLSRTIQAAGYTDREQAKLFSNNDSDPVAEIPPFLVKILERFIQDKSPWSYQIAKNNWFWGYTWESANPKDIFNDWLSIAMDLGFALPSTDGSFNFLELSTLGSRIQAAENWLAADYPAIVRKMQEVFGEGEVEQLFGCEGSIGTKTALAREKLQSAKGYLKGLKTNENNFSEMTEFEQKKQQILTLAQQRLKLIAAVNFVFNQNSYNDFIKDDNDRTLDFRNDDEPLWLRLRRAELFCDRILRIGESLKQQIESLQSEMRSKVMGLEHFPIQLFTLSLEKIRHILDGAIHVSTPLGSTEKLQMTDASALGQCLKDLRIAEATDRLKQLCREAGLNIEGTTIAEIPFEQIDGKIVTGFRRFTQEFENIHEKLADAKSRLNKLEQQLKDAPTDFSYPADIEGLDRLKLKSTFIDDSLATIQEEEAESLRGEQLYDRPAKQGNFQPLMKQAEGLLTVPRQNLNQLTGQILTIENAIRGFISELLNQPEIQSIKKSLNQLLKAKKQTPRSPLSRPELEQSGSLSAAVAKVEARRTECFQVANELLLNTVSFERWQRIMAAVERGDDPDLTTTEETQLVRSGLLVRTYRLGG